MGVDRDPIRSREKSIRDSREDYGMGMPVKECRMEIMAFPCEGSKGPSPLVVEVNKTVRLEEEKSSRTVNVD